MTSLINAGLSKVAEVWSLRLASNEIWVYTSVISHPLYVFSYDVSCI